MAEHDEGEGRTIRPFPDFLMDHHSGRTAAELAEKLNELVQAVRDTEKGGALTLTLKIEPLAKGDVETLVVTADIKVKIPELARKGAVFFPDGENNLRRESPDRPRLPLREVGGPRIEAEDEDGKVIDATARG